MKFAMFFLKNTVEKNEVKKSMTTSDNEQILKKKINLLIKKNQQVDDQIRAVEDETEAVKEEKKILNMQLEAEAAKMVQSGESKIVLFVKDFCKIAEQMVEEKKYIPYQYETKYSGDFYKIEKNAFEQLIGKNTAMELKCFLQYCADLQVVKKEKGKICFTSGGVKVYYVSRAFVNEAVRG